MFGNQENALSSRKLERNSLKHGHTIFSFLSPAVMNIQSLWLSVTAFCCCWFTFVPSNQACINASKGGFVIKTDFECFVNEE